jgi:hypothetical protein
VTAATATGGVEEPRPPAVEEARAGSGGAALAATASPRLEERRRDREEVLKDPVLPSSGILKDT